MHTTFGGQAPEAARPQPWWRYVRNRTRTIAHASCGQCAYTRTLDTAAVDVASTDSKRLVRNAALAHARNHNHDVTYTLTVVRRWFGSRDRAVSAAEAKR